MKGELASTKQREQNGSKQSLLISKRPQNATPNPQASSQNALPNPKQHHQWGPGAQTPMTTEDFPCH